MIFVNDAERSENVAGAADGGEGAIAGGVDETDVKEGVAEGRRERLPEDDEGDMADEMGILFFGMTWKTSRRLQRWTLVAKFATWHLMMKEIKYSCFKLQP
jgi:hypothetical protein